MRVIYQWPDKSSAPTVLGAAARPEDFRGSAVAVHVARRQWLNTGRWASLHIMKYITLRSSGFFVLFLFLILGLSGCLTADTAMISGVTRADPVLKRDTYRQIKICEWGCAGTKYGQGAIKYENPKIEEIVIIGEPAIPDGSWKENWKVARVGGVTAIYTITFQPSPRGGTDIRIKFPPEILP
jgi:hypothetical protein